MQVLLGGEGARYACVIFRQHQHFCLENQAHLRLRNGYFKIFPLKICFTVLTEAFFYFFFFFPEAETVKPPSITFFSNMCVGQKV